MAFESGFVLVVIVIIIRIIMVSSIGWNLLNDSFGRDVDLVVLVIRDGNGKVGGEEKGKGGDAPNELQK